MQCAQLISVYILSYSSHIKTVNEMSQVTSY